MFITDAIMKSTAMFDSFLSRTFRSNGPIESPQNSRPFQGISVVKKLNKGKFPIYLTTSKTTKQKYAMKVFSQVSGEAHSCYKNEIRFATLKHPNVIDMVHYESQKDTFHRNEFKKVSYILMEYAPHGDFFNFAVKHRDQLDEMLIRTYFRQLIDGIEYLHTNAVIHLDLKPENLLIGADFNLKIADFDLSHIYGDEKILSKGTRYYRAPEFYNFGSSSSSPMEEKDLFASDIYSAGIILFIFKSGGIYPHAENQLLDGTSYVDLMYNDNSKFWEKHCEIQGRETSFFSEDFTELFNSMVASNPKERPTIEQIKESKWYNGPIYTPSELQGKMNSLLGC